MFRSVKTALLLAVVALWPLGCGGGASVSSYHPKSSAAKAAFTAALEAWKSGREKPGTPEHIKPAVKVQDSVWESGRKLKEFQIGDEQPATNGLPRFTVKLTFDGLPATEDAEYVVFGIDPLWVSRDKDYQRMSGR